MLRIAIVFAVLMFSNSVVYAVSVFEGLKFDKHLYGEEITPKDLKGKVVFFEYWGVFCEPCTDFFPELQELQEKYAPTGKFTIVANHVPAGSKGRILKFLQTTSTTFPVFQGIDLDDIKDEGFIPYAILINHMGEVIAKGHPATIKSQIDELVKATPATIIGDVALKHFKKEAKALEFGKSLKTVFSKLEKRAKKDTPKGAEAKHLLKNAKQFLENETIRLEKLSATNPAEALIDLTILKKRIKGMPEEEKIKELHTALAKNSNVKTLSKSILTLKNVLPYLKDVKCYKNKGTRNKVESKIKKERRTLNKILKKDDLLPSLKEEAQNWLDKTKNLKWKMK